MMRKMMLVAMVGFVGIGVFWNCRSAFASETSTWAGNFLCIVDDKSEIYDNEYSNGHSYFDLDGDNSDPKTQIPASISRDNILLGQLFAGKPGSTSKYKIIKVVTSDKRPSILGIRVEDPNGDDIEVVIFSRDNKTGKYGFSQFESTYISPVMLNGESQVLTNLVMGHCIKQ
jgi:hypothetical protein